MSWFKRKKVSPKELVSPSLGWNVAELHEKLEKLSNNLFEHRASPAFTILREIVQTAYNVQILEVTRFTQGDADLAKHRGRLQAFADLQAYIDTAMTANQEERRTREAPQVRGEIRMVSPREGRKSAQASV